MLTRQNAWFSDRPSAASGNFFYEHGCNRGIVVYKPYVAKEVPVPTTAADRTQSLDRSCRYCSGTGLVRIP